MKFSRNNLAFVSVLMAGVLLAVASFALPSAKTFGSETDDKARAAALADYVANLQPVGAPSTQPSQPASQAPAPSTQAPAPPAAPLDNNSAPSAANGGVVGNTNGLPSTGEGGLMSGTSTNYGFLLTGLGVALLGSGSLVWAVSRKRR